MDKSRTTHELLVEDANLPERNRDHTLSGDWDGYRECHIEPDWLLIYRSDEVNEVLGYVRMGSHAELFR